MQQVLFHYADRKLSFSAKSKIKETILSIFKKEEFVLKRLDYIFCSDDYLLSINQKFLNHDYYTDIITFDLSESGPVRGEIYISIDRIKENASSIGITFYEELARVTFHGALHLCGYKDKKKEEKALMRKKENYYLNLLQSK